MNLTSGLDVNNSCIQLLKLTLISCACRFFGINLTSGLEVNDICIELGPGIRPREEHWFHLASEVDTCMLCMNLMPSLEVGRSILWPAIITLMCCKSVN